MKLWRPILGPVVTLCGVGVVLAGVRASAESLSPIQLALLEMRAHFLADVLPTASSELYRALEDFLGTAGSRSPPDETGLVRLVLAFTSDLTEYYRGFSQKVGYFKELDDVSLTMPHASDVGLSQKLLVSQCWRLVKNWRVFDAEERRSLVSKLLRPLTSTLAAFYLPPASGEVTGPVPSSVVPSHLSTEDEETWSRNISIALVRDLEESAMRRYELLEEKLPSIGDHEVLAVNEEIRGILVSTFVDELLERESELDLLVFGGSTEPDQGYHLPLSRAADHLQQQRSSTRYGPEVEREIRDFVDYVWFVKVEYGIRERVFRKTLPLRMREVERTIFIHVLNMDIELVDHILPI